VGWYWHFVEAGLRERGHEVVAPDLPCDDDLADLRDYADMVVDAIGDRSDLVVVGQSYAASLHRWWPIDSRLRRSSSSPA
jgi:hypothetical protein